MTGRSISLTPPPFVPLLNNPMIGQPLPHSYQGHPASLIAPQPFIGSGWPCNPTQGCNQACPLRPCVQLPLPPQITRRKKPRLENSSCIFNSTKQRALKEDGGSIISLPVSCKMKNNLFSRKCIKNEDYDKRGQEISALELDAGRDLGVGDTILRVLQ